jgi:hypothetical protein
MARTLVYDLDDCKGQYLVADLSMRVGRWAIPKITPSQGGGMA